jgi:methyl coenzyme M reductase alpha subunit
LARLGVYDADADADVAAASASSVCANAVKEAKVLGLEITEEEFMEYLNSINSVLAGGELADEQLDAVAGGGVFGDARTKILKVAGVTV